MPTYVERKGKKVEGVKRASGVIRILHIIFHPAVLAFVILITLISLRLYQIITVIRTPAAGKMLVDKNASASINASNASTDHALEFSKPPPSNQTLGRTHKRVKRDKNNGGSEAWVDDEAVEEEEEAEEEEGEDDDSPYENKDDSENEEEPLILTGDRRAALSSVDDMLLDAETSMPVTFCLTDEEVEDLETQQQDNLKKRQQDEENAELSEHLEACEDTSDCLILSPFLWMKEGSGEECRKRTYLRCNSAEKVCECQDRYDLRWDTVVDQSVYQWNPITKTCYVRGTNACKLEIPCAPGTLCRTTVSISYNTPPIQRICECANIEHQILATNRKWWYCAEYYQRNWVFDMDNILKWRHKPFHLYEKMKVSKLVSNGSTVKTKTLH